MVDYFSDMKDVYEGLKLANNGYTKVSYKIRSHVDALVALGKAKYITPDYVALIEDYEVAKETFFNPK